MTNNAGISLASTVHAPYARGHESRAAHAQDDDVSEAALDLFGEFQHRREIRGGLLRGLEPAQRVADDLRVRLIVLPQRGIAFPDPRDDLLLVRAGDDVVDVDAVKSE